MSFCHILKYNIYLIIMQIFIQNEPYISYHLFFYCSDRRIWPNLYEIKLKTTRKPIHGTIEQMCFHMTAQFENP